MSTYPFIPIAKRYEKEDEHGRPIGDFCFDYELGLIMTSKRSMSDTFFYLGELPVQMHIKKKNVKNQDVFIQNGLRLRNFFLENIQNSLRNCDLMRCETVQ